MFFTINQIQSSRALYVLAFILVFGISSNAQTAISGKVTDAASGEPLPFANIIINKNPHLGTVTDIDGKFKYSGKETITTAELTYVGYSSQIISVSPANAKSIHIKLVFNSNEIQELVITGENPANAIMRRVIANKEINDPENIASFRYKTYNKTIYDFRYKNNANLDSIKAHGLLKGGHMFMMESVTDRKYIKPDRSEEVVLATKVSGFKNPTFASLATDLQPFSFYKDNVKFLNTNYLNPISRGSLSKYRFSIQDTLYRDNDTIYVIAYKPKPGKNFDGLKGLLYINTKKYAVQNVTAEPFEKGKIDIKIRQQYAYTKEGYWFPEQLDYTLEFTEFPKKDMGMYSQGKSYIDSVEINIPLRKRDFAVESVWMDEKAAKKDSLYWLQHRREDLNLAENTTYKVLDSIGKEVNFDQMLMYIEKISQWRVPIGSFDLDLSKTLVFNKYEGVRLGLGFYTNENLFDKLSIGGFFGYGTKDFDWKFGGEAIYTFSKRKEIKLKAKYEDNLIEMGNHGFQYPAFGYYSSRNILASQMDRVEKASVDFGFRAFRYFKWDFGVSTARITPKYDYTFTDNGKDYKTYRNTELTANLKFAFGEKIIGAFNQNVSLGTTYPTLYLMYARGIKGVFESDFGYNRIEAVVEQSFYTKNLGKTSYRLEGGYIDNPLPAGLLFTGEGSFDKEYPFIMKNTFQTMYPYEFLSDRYVNLFTSHNFGGLLLKTKIFQPEISIHNNFSWGDLSNQVNHSLAVGYKTKSKIYSEAGLQLDNIIKFNYMNIGYFTMGAGVYYRYGAYHLPAFEDNLAGKVTFNFTFK